MKEENIIFKRPLLLKNKWWDSKFDPTIFYLFADNYTRASALFMMPVCTWIDSW
jgi:hypothetical protein